MGADFWIVRLTAEGPADYPQMNNLKGGHVIDVLRWLHESTELERHVPPAALPGRVPG